jgi:hypothetical protein
VPALQQKAGPDYSATRQLVDTFPFMQIRPKAMAMDGTDTHAKVNESDLRQAILGFVLKHPGCTLAQLVEDVPGCAGSLTYDSSFSNLILWNGVSADALDALRSLEHTRMIRFEATTVHPYGEAGRSMKLTPVMKFEDCRFPRWLPVLVHVNRLALKGIQLA